MDLRHHSAREEASQWLAKLDRGLRHDEGATLRKWLQRSAHRAAILELARRQAAPDVMAILSELFPISLHTLPEKPRRGAVGIIVSLTAAACVVAVGIWMFNHQQVWAQFARAGPVYHDSHGALHPPVLREDYSTAVGQQRQIKLPDGSVMMLNTDSNASVDYSLRERGIHLSRGEAGFSVGHESARPFLLRVGHHHCLEATGTRFNVRVLTSDTLELIVIEGQVTVLYTPREGPDTPARARLSNNRIFDDTRIEALEMAQLEPGLQFVRKVEKNEIEDVLAWQRGRIVFKSARLEDALAELDRYTSTRFVMFDERLRDLRVAGDFSTSHIDDFLVSLRRNYRIEVMRSGDGRIVLRSLPSAPEGLPQRRM